MIPSKITMSITIFVAVCFRNYSEAVETRLEDCYTDSYFLSLAKKHIADIVPILVSIDENDTHEQIIGVLKSYKFPIIIKLHVEKGKCPITKLYLEPGEQYPVVFVLLFNHVHKETWKNTSNLVDFIDIAVRKQQIRSGKGAVTEMIEQLIANNGIMQVDHQGYDAHFNMRTAKGKFMKKPKKNSETKSNQDVNLVTPNLGDLGGPLKSVVPRTSKTKKRNLTHSETSKVLETSYTQKRSRTEE